MAKESSKVLVNNISVRMKRIGDADFVCISDIAQSREGYPSEYIRSYLKNQTNFGFLRRWEEVHNKEVNSGQMAAIADAIIDGGYRLSLKSYLEQTNAMGFVATAGRYAATFAHIDIAIHFCTWFDRDFYIYFIKEFQRLKQEESNLYLKQWDLRRELSKASYQIQTDAIREHLSPVLDWHTDREIPLFASEADLLNQAVFGMTAKEFKAYKPDFKGNLRDFATTEQLEVLNGLQHLNAGLIEQGLTQGERFQLLSRRAKKSLDVLESNQTFQKLLSTNKPK
jgi:hypothetical protein